MQELVKRVGRETNLTAAEVDGNFTTIKTAVDLLEGQAETLLAADTLLGTRIDDLTALIPVNVPLQVDTINDLGLRGQPNAQGASTFPTPWTFIPPGTSPLTGFVTRFQVEFDAAEVGRKVIFYILRRTPNTNSFTRVYFSDELPAESTGVNTFSPAAATPAAIQTGDYVAAFINTATPATGGIKLYTSGGPDLIGGGGWDYQSSLPSSFTVPDSDVQYTTRFFPIEAQVATKVSQTAFQLDAYGNMPINVVRAPDAPWKGKRILWLGTSIPAVGDLTSYPKLIEPWLQATVINNAMGSSGVCWNGTRQLSLSATVAELAAAYPGYEDQSYEVRMLGHTPDLVVFDHLYNDHGFPVGVLADSNWDRTTQFGAMEFLIDKLYAENPTVRLAFVTPPTKYATGGAADVTARVQIMALADKYGAPLLDVTNLAGLNRYTQGTYTVDGLHPNEVLRQRIARLIYPWLLSF
jgi:lysophospholipase L1-like esterase